MWDVTKFTKYLVTLDCDKEVSFKDLISTLTMLLPLISVARTSEIYFLVARYLVKHSSGYILQFVKTLKHQKSVYLEILNTIHQRKQKFVCLPPH